MAMTDASRQSDALPSISYIDLEKIKRENPFYSSRFPSTAVTNMPAPPLASPSSMYSGPPPPYSYPASTASSVVGAHTNGYISPPIEPRHLIDDEKEQQRVRQSLPSIHEALKRDQSLSITSLLTKPSVPPPPSSHQIHLGNNTSPTSPVNLSYKDISSTGPPASPARTRSSPVYSEDLPRMHPSSRPTPDTMGSRLTSMPSRETPYPPMFPPRTIPSPAGISRPPLASANLRHSPPTYEPVSRPMPPMNPPQTYTSNPSIYSSALPMQTSVSSYQPPSPSNPHGWRYGDPESERAEECRRQMVKESNLKPTFGEAVKRHLDNFDLETSLNEIAECSGRTLDFTNHYGSRAHQTQRSGPIPGSLPSLDECDEMIGYQKKVLDSMHRIKEVIIAQQHALAEQRNYEKYKPPSEADEDGASFLDKVEGAGGFAGADSKKRRGRAAPPGRCHSCNRAETPEWRRGPDGARTLCNACGLHYAKLTRKMGSKSSTTGSNLRPKEMSQNSP